MGCAMVSCSLSASSPPSQRLITTVATPLPMRLVSARHSLMNLSMPSRMAIDWMGMSGTIASVAASVTKPAPVTPEAPFEVIMAISSRPSERHVDVGTVEIEAVPGRDHETHDRARRAQPLHFLHHLRQHRFRRAGADHDQKLVLDIGDEAKDREPGKPRDRAEHDQDEQQRGEEERAEHMD